MSAGKPVVWKRLAASWMLGVYLLTSTASVAAGTPRPSTPAPRADVQRGAAPPEETESRVEQISSALERIGELARQVRPTGKAPVQAAQVSRRVGGDRDPLVIAKAIVDEVARLGEFESVVQSDWAAEARVMTQAGTASAIMVRQGKLTVEFQGKAAEFRRLTQAVASAVQSGSRAATTNALIALANWLSPQQNARGFRSVEKARLPVKLAKAGAVPPPKLGTTAGVRTLQATADAPTAADTAPTLEVEFTAEIQALAQQLGANPIAIRNWVYNHIEFDPTFGSIQGAALTLLNRRGNAMDIASLTLALLRSAGVPSRYAMGPVELPADKVRNWLGNLPSAAMAVDLMQKGQIPATGVVSGGEIRTIRFWHVWAEAYADFVPSRGAIGQVPDQWVPIDAAFKQFEYQAPLPWRTKVDAGFRQAAITFAKGTQVDATGGITGFDYDTLNQSLQQLARTTAGQVIAGTPGATSDQLFERRQIIPLERLLFEGALPYQVVSAQPTRFSEVPAQLRHMLRIAFYADATFFSYDSPSEVVEVPLPRIGTRRLHVNYAPASEADAQVLAQYAASNAASMPIGQLNVVPEIKLDDVTLAQGGAVRMGTQQAWTTDLRDAHGQLTATEAYRFAAGSHIVFVPNVAGVMPDRAERETVSLPDRANLPIRDALYYGGLIYWMLHDRFDAEAAQFVGGRALRLPSVGAFSAPMQVRYFFGIPRTGSFRGYATDVKVVQVALSTPKPADALPVSLHLGAGGSLSESVGWNFLTGSPLDNAGMSATSLMRLAIDQGQPIYQIDASNADTALNAMQLSADAESEIRDAAQAGLLIIAHKRELKIRGWSGSGYVILDPATGSAMYRVEGGLAGGINVGCVAKAVLLKALCETKLIKKAKEYLLKLIARTGVTALATSLLTTLLGPAGAVVGSVIAVTAIAVSYAMAAYEVYQWVRMVMEGIDTLTPEELAELGISALNDVACSYGPPCLGGFGGGGFGGGGGGGGGGSGGPLVGNPTAVGTGAKWQAEADYEGAGPFPLRFVRAYSSAIPRAGSFIGAKWTATYFAQLRLPPSTEGSTFPTNQRPDAVLLVRPDGGWYQFNWRSDRYVGDTNLPGSLTRLTSAGNTIGWEYFNEDDEVERYDAQGWLLSISHRSGLKHTLAHDALGRLLSVTDSFNRHLTFAYDPDTGYLASVTDPANRTVTYHHDDNGNLIKVVYPDSHSREYHYEDLANRFHLTGITDERGVLTSTWTYDHSGRVKVAERAGGVERYTLNYDELETTVTDPLGTVRTYQYVIKYDRKYLKSTSEPCVSCGASNSAETSYDNSGFVSSIRDFRGNTTTYARDARGLVTSRTEAADTSNARTTTTTWHPQFRLPVRIVEPIRGGTRTFDFTYDVKGNLLTRKATAGAESRTWTWTYNSNGQVLTEDGPRTDVQDIITYTYDPQGNLATMTDVLGHVTRYTHYDANGRLLSMTDPNGLVTEYVYNARDHLIESGSGPSGSQARETTHVDYDAAGNVTLITRPDGSSLSYTYDGAGRLTAMADSSGSRTSYTLDGMGNHTENKVRDPSDAVVLTGSRVYDALGRLKELLGAQNQKTSYRYDISGNETQSTDPLEHVTERQYDEFNRLKRVIDPANGSVAYGYDPQGNLISITDPRQLTTHYVYSGFDELSQLQSPDTSTTTYAYDAAGNLTRQTDARNVRADSVYDAADRPITVTYPDERLDFTYDAPAGGAGAKGRLTSAKAIPIGTDSQAVANTLNVTYDAHGRPIAMSQSVGATPTAATTKAVSYRYAANGELSGMILPSGAEVSYGFGAEGRVASVKVNGQTILREIEYFPFGEVRSWIHGSGGDRYERRYDKDGRITEHTVGRATRTLHYDAASRVIGLEDSGATPWSNWTYAYDPLDRLTAASNAATDGPNARTHQGWTYDATDNRLTESSGVDGLPPDPSVTYTIDAASNRVTTIGGTVTDTRQYDAAGNTTRWRDQRGAPAGTVLEATYGGRNRLLLVRQGGVPVARYTYNAFDERIAKWTGAAAASTSSAPTLQFVYDETGHLIGEYDSLGNLIAEHLWIENTPVAVLRPASGSHGGLAAGAVEVYFVHPDHLDTPRAIVNATGETIWRWDSAPFGDTDAQEQPTAGLPKFTYALRFPGQYFDPEVGTHYNYYRDYEADLGRYIESDPIGLWGGLNSYAYVGAAPLLEIDEEGLRCTTRNRLAGRCRPRQSTPPNIAPPTGGGVYAMRDCRGHVVYVGKTNNFKTRMSAHWSTGGQLPAFHRPECGCPVTVEFLKFKKYTSARGEKVEKYLIDHFQPPGNTHYIDKERTWSWSDPCCK